MLPAFSPGIEEVTHALGSSRGRAGRRRYGRFIGKSGRLDLLF
jgi:hypothetical protein